MIGYWHQFESLTITDVCIYSKTVDTDGSVQIIQLCAPKNEVSKILTLFHYDIAAGDLGIAKTLQRVRKRFYGPGVKRDVEVWVSSCNQCQKRKGPKQKHRMPM